MSSREANDRGACGLNRREFVGLAAAAAAAGVGGVGGVSALGAGVARAGQPAAGAGDSTGAALPDHPRVKGTPLTGMIRVGVIGCGGRGTGAALQALRADPDVKLVAMGDVFADRLKSSLAAITKALGEEAAARLEVPAERQFTGFDCHTGVLAAGVDVVLLCGYPGFRPAQYKAAIDAGKHVFLEKPLAVDAPGVRTVLEAGAASRAKGLTTLTGFCWRHNAGMREAYKRLHVGAIGDLVTAHTTYYTSTLTKNRRQPNWSDMEFQLRNWWHFNWLSGDHIVEQAVHSIDRLSWAMGDVLPQRVICLGGRAARTGPESGNVFDHFSAVYEWADGRRGFHSTRQIDGCPSDNTDYLYGTRGSSVVDSWRPLYQTKDRAGAVTWEYAEKSPDMYQAEHDALFAGLRSGNMINDLDRGANSTMLAIMARMAAYTGQTITWEQALNSTESLVPPTLAMGPLDVVPVPIPGKTKFS